MVTPLPRVLLAAPASGEGKTTLAAGVMAALCARGLAVASFKTGPDYIDPGYHGLATGRPGRNLDAHLCGPELMAPLLLHGSLAGAPGGGFEPVLAPESLEGGRPPSQARADIAVVEGAMGLFDGRLGVPPVGRAGFASSAHVAKLTRTPVVLVLDASHSSRSLAAVAAGIARHDPDVHVAGVILNKTGSPRAVEALREAMAEVELRVLGCVPRSKDLVTPSRHLGLVPAAERDQARATVDAAAALVAEHVDLDALLEVARHAPALEAEPWDPSAVVTPVSGRPRIAIAAGRAFTFRYAETTELLAAAGCEVVEFDPLADAALPEGTAGLYLGGGFPEVFARELAHNVPLRTDIRRKVTAGLPTVAECAGLLYLCDRLDEEPMTGVLGLSARMTPRLTLGYRELVAGADSLLFRTGETVASHEFHRTDIDLAAVGDAGLAATPPRECVHGGVYAHTCAEVPAETPGCHPAADAAAATLGVAWQIGERDEGVCSPRLHASYQHLHWAGFPLAAQRFAHAAARYAAGGQAGPSWTMSWREDVDPPAGEPAPPAAGAPEADLAHHGDRDLADGLVDLAVNVHAPQPPRWLAELIARPERWAAYPDARPARAALAARHGLDEAMVLPTAGAAEAFTLVARALDVQHAVVVHPQFTEPEQALRLAGRPVERVLLRPEDGFALHPADVPAAADLVVVGNPTNPTGALHPAAVLRTLARPGRVLLVDEAFMDAVPGEPETLLGHDMRGILVTRSLTKTWSLAGIRAGYLAGDPALVARLEALQTPWSVSTPAVDAMVACSTPQALAEQERIAAGITGQREVLVAELVRAGLAPVPSRAPFVLVGTSRLGPASLREPLARQGFAVRRGESFPGLGPAWLRLAVRDPQTSRQLGEAIRRLQSSEGSAR